MSVAAISPGTGPAGPVLSASGLTLRHGPVAALAGLDLAVPGGAWLAVTGPNGAGKTTFLRLAATLVRPSGGRLELFGEPQPAGRDLVRPRLGYAGHQLGLYADLTARENLRLFARLYGVRSQLEAALLESVGVGGGGDRPVRELSRGQQQRVALARSLVHDPELWILDEPDAGLDSSAVELLVRLGRGRTVLMATHDLAVAEVVGTLRLHLHGGRRVPEGEAIA